MKTPRSTVKRIPSRGFYDKETIYKILDADFVCQVGFIHSGNPVVIPVIYGRKNDFLFFHGAAVSRMMRHLERGLPVSINVTRTDAIVLARSAFHHSLNYHSVTLFGNATLVEDADEKTEALKTISDQIIPGRWEEVRPPSDSELKQTKVLKLKIEEGAAKIRTGMPSDEEADYERDIWAGLLPLEKRFARPVADERLKSGVMIPESVKKMIE